MKKINFEGLPSTNTPISPDNLNQMQSNIEESAVVVSATEPTTNEKVWIQKGNNLFNEQFRQGGWNNTTATTRIYSAQNKIIEAGQYTFSSNIDTSIYKIGVNVNTKPFPSTSSSFYDSGWLTINEKTFTASQRGYLGIGVSRVDGGDLTPDDIKDFYFQVNTGSEAKPYEEYIPTKIHCKNNNEAYEEIYNEENQENYSTAEQKIGTWIDRKPLYRKTIDFGTLPNNTAKTASLGVGDIENVVNIQGISKDTSNLCIPIPFVSASSPVTINYSASTDLITVTSTSNRTAFTKTYITIEYTKTTD